MTRLDPTDLNVPGQPTSMNGHRKSTSTKHRRAGVHPGLERQRPESNGCINLCLLVVGVLLEVVYIIMLWLTIYRALSIRPTWFAIPFAVCMLVCLLWALWMLVMRPQTRMKEILKVARFMAIVSTGYLLTTIIHFVLLYEDTRNGLHHLYRPPLDSLKVARSLQCASLPLLLTVIIFSCYQSCRPYGKGMENPTKSWSSTVYSDEITSRQHSRFCARRAYPLPQMDGAVDDERAASKSTFLATRLRRLQLKRKQVHCPLRAHEMGVAIFSLIMLVIVLGILLGYWVIEAKGEKLNRSTVIGLWASVAIVALLIAGILSLILMRCTSKSHSAEALSQMDTGPVSNTEHSHRGSILTTDMPTFLQGSAYSTPDYSSGTATPTHASDFASRRGSALRGKRKADRIEEEEEDAVHPPRLLPNPPPEPPAIAPMPKRKATVTFALDGERAIVARPGDSEDSTQPSAGNKSKDRVEEWLGDSDEWTTSTGSMLSEFAPAAHLSKKRSSSFPFGMDGHLGDCTIVRPPITPWWTDAAIYDGTKTVRPLRRARPSVLSVVREYNHSLSRVIDEEAGIAMQQGIERAI